MFLHRNVGVKGQVTALILAGSLGAAAAPGQTAAAPSVPGGTRPQQVQISGRNDSSGAVVVTQQSPSGGTDSVNAGSTTLQINGSFAGSEVSLRGATGPVRVLTISEALQMGLRNNLGQKSAARSQQQARAAQAATRSALLPYVNAQISENVEKVNLATSGFDAASFPSIGQYFPTTVGPFHYYSAQVNVSDDLLDLTASANLATSKLQTIAAAQNSGQAREQVTLAVAGSYLRILSTVALAKSEDAQVRYSKAIYDQSLAQEEAGAKAHVEVNRNLVQLQTEEQRLTADLASVAKEKMTLARIIGLSIDEDFDVSEGSSNNDPEDLTLPTAYERALTSRSDLHAAETQLKVAESARKAAGAQRLPTLKLQGYYGVQGINPNSGATVYNGSAQISIPVFNGGQIRSDEQQADAATEQRKSELADTREQVRFDVRTAWIDRDVATKQVVVADSNRKLAAETLKQSSDRFFAGATTSVEVVQAEQALAEAERDYIASVFSLNLARINLARAMGEAEKDIPALIKGMR